MTIRKNISLKPYNTFGIDVIARSFIEIKDINQIEELYQKDLLNDIFIIGYGSNILLTKDVKCLTLKLSTKGKSIISEENNDVIVKSCAGEDWPEFVLWSVDNGLYGLENLSKIPGNVGTSPIQNIGAYGTEIKDTFYKLDAFEIKSGEIKTFYNSDCDFGYRDSIFKNDSKNKYIITHVYFKLKRQGDLNIGYGAIKSILESNNIYSPTLKDVSNSIIEIRTSKLPDPNEIGNSGSFFKNPVINTEQFNTILKKYPNIPSYKLDNGDVKIPAGWLIETSGWKGYRKGDAGVHEKQALVLVNYGNATGKDILNLANEIRKDIDYKFNIKLEIEVNIF